MSELKECHWCGSKCDYITLRPIDGNGGPRFDPYCTNDACIGNGGKERSLPDVIEAFNTPHDAWISVKDRQPEKEGMYLCFWHNCYTGSVYYGNGKWVEAWGKDPIKVNYWRPLPPGPRGNNG